jgi:protein-S-isoprenylcysteine O-methyltransferase Ste14
MERAYRWFAYMGLMVVSASLLLGFRHDAAAPASNAIFDFLAFAAYMAVHYLMLTPGWKRLTSGRPEGDLRERQIYVTVAVTTWVVLYAVHRPLPGPALELPVWIAYVGACGFLLSLLAFVEGATFESLKGLLGIPGGAHSHTATAQTPLMTEGSYASVRHPMYRAFLFMALSSLALHPNAAQLLWALVLTSAFVVFIPIEERQLIAARGDEYRRFMQATPYRLLRGVW